MSANSALTLWKSAPAAGRPASPSWSSWLFGVRVHDVEVEPAVAVVVDPAEPTAHHGNRLLVTPNRNAPWRSSEADPARDILEANRRQLRRSGPVRTRLGSLCARVVVAEDRPATTTRPGRPRSRVHAGAKAACAWKPWYAAIAAWSRGRETPHCAAAEEDVEVDPQQPATRGGIRDEVRGCARGRRQPASPVMTATWGCRRRSEESAGQPRCLLFCSLTPGTSVRWETQDRPAFIAGSQEGRHLPTRSPTPTVMLQK